jgi:hypothetical protein
MTLPNQRSDELAIVLAVLLVLLVYLTPIIWVLVSGRSRGGAKFGWFLVTLVFSWLGLAAFLIITQASKDRQLDQ